MSLLSAKYMSSIATVSLWKAFDKGWFWAPAPETCWGWGRLIKTFSNQCYNFGCPKLLRKGKGPHSPALWPWLTASATTLTPSWFLHCIVFPMWQASHIICKMAHICDKSVLANPFQSNPFRFWIAILGLNHNTSSSIISIISAKTSGKGLLPHKCPDIEIICHEWPRTQVSNFSC